MNNLLDLTSLIIKKGVPVLLEGAVDCRVNSRLSIYKGQKLFHVSTFLTTSLKGNLGTVAFQSF
jgi:hypothetical protein